VFGAIAVDVLVEAPRPGETIALAIAAGAAGVLVVAAVGIAAMLRPAPRNAVEWLWLTAPVAGAGALAWASIVAVG